MAKKKAKTTTNPFSALVLQALKQEVNQKATALIENVRKAKHGFAGSQRALPR
jgi:hypothetical protein